MKGNVVSVRNLTNLFACKVNQSGSCEVSTFKCVTIEVNPKHENKVRLGEGDPRVTGINWDQKTSSVRLWDRSFWQEDAKVSGKEINAFWMNSVFEEAGWSFSLRQASVGVFLKIGGLMLLNVLYGFSKHNWSFCEVIGYCCALFGCDEKRERLGDGNDEAVVEDKVGDPETVLSFIGLFEGVLRTLNIRASTHIKIFKVLLKRKTTYRKLVDFFVSLNRFFHV
jgi:hypothetical protein